MRLHLNTLLTKRRTLFLLLLFMGLRPVLAQHSDSTVLIGKVTRVQLEAYTWFASHYANYKLNDSVVQASKPLTQNVSVTIVAGTWCSDSREHVPAFYKVADALHLNDTNIHMIAVNRKKERVITPELEALHFEYVPTLVFYRNGKEIGRIVEDTKVSMEKDMLEILKQ